MRDHHYTWRCWQIVFVVCVGCVLALLSSGGQALAASPSTSYALRLNVEVGYGSLAVYRAGHWVPIRVTIANAGSDFRGTLSINTYRTSTRVNNTGQSTWEFNQPVSVPQQQESHFTLYVPFTAGNTLPQGVIARLRDEQGRMITTETAHTGYEIRSGSLLVGVLADKSADLSALELLSLPTQSMLSSVRLDEDTLPTVSTILDSFDIIVLDDFSSARLSASQVLALQTWVNRGGILVEAGGPQWQRTLEPLPARLLPVNIRGSTTLPSGTHLVSSSDPLALTSDAGALTSPIPASIAANSAELRQDSTSFQNTTVLSSGSTPLLVQARQGQGIICYTAIDMADPQLANWDGQRELWQFILMHTLGDIALLSNTYESYHGGPGQLFTHPAILNMVEPETLDGPFILIALILAYALLLGPLRLLFIRKKTRPHSLNWRIILCLVAVFSAISYGMAQYLRTASIIDQSVDLVQVNQDGTSAHVTTYSGILVPEKGDFTLHTPGQALMQPLANQFLPVDRRTPQRSELPAAISEMPADTSLQLKNMNQWSLRYTETEQDIHLPGKLASHLQLNDNRLTGTITNTLNTALNDVFVLLPQSIVPIGHLEAGETRQVNVPLQNVSFYSGKNLADVIATYSHLPEGYFPYTHNDVPHSDLERHVALLEALEGVGTTFSPCQSSCRTHAVPSKESLFITGGRVPNPNVNAYEPLLLNNAPATLIGWSSQSPAANTTINDWNPEGQHESFIQMPLDISGNLNTPSNVLTGQVVNLQSYDAELPLVGVYALTAGSITFEFTMPPGPGTRSATITIPDLWAHPFGPTPDLSINTSHLRARLYNWQTGAWDSISLTQDSFTTSIQPYTNSAGRILLQVSNQDSTLGRLYFGKPALHLT